jgi:hypothetical protein
MTRQDWGAVIIALSFTSYFLGWLRTASAVGVFAGIIMVGINGWLISKVAVLLGWIEGLAGPYVTKLAGVSLAGFGAAVVCVVGWIVLHDWMPRNAAKKRTFWLSALLAIFIVTAATPFAALNSLPAQVGNGVTTVQGG